MKNKKLLLIDPPMPSGFYAGYPHPAAGIMYIGTLARARGVETRVLLPDIEGRALGRIKDYVRGFAPDVVGITAPTVKMGSASQLARIVKNVTPEAWVVVGGYHPTAFPEKTFSDNPEIDILVLGEGEETMIELLEAFKSGIQDLSGIRGIAFRSKDGVRINESRPFIDDLNRLPFIDWSLVNYRKIPSIYHREPGAFELEVYSSRGCNRGCLFCARTTGPKVRYRDPDCVAEEIRLGVERFGCLYFGYMDEDIAHDPVHLHGVCDALIKRDLHGRIRWYAMMRADSANPRVMQKMKSAGCEVILMGAESGNQEVLDKNKKGITLGQVRQAVSWAREVGIIIDLSFMIGLPYDTIDTIRDTVRFATQLDSEIVSFQNFVPYPLTESYRLAKQGRANLRLLSEDWDRYHPQAPRVVELIDVNRHKLERLRLGAYLRYYSRPHRIVYLLKMIRPSVLPRFFKYMAKLLLYV